MTTEPEIQVRDCSCGSWIIHVIMPDDSAETYHWGRIPTTLAPDLRERMRAAVKVWREAYERHD